MPARTPPPLFAARRETRDAENRECVPELIFNADVPDRHGIRIDNGAQRVRARYSGGAIALSLLVFSALSHAQSAVSCDSLSSLKLANATVTSAQEYKAGEFKLPRTGGGGSS